MGPPGVGKTHLSTSLGIHAVNQGYQVSFILVDYLVYILKTREYLSKSKTQYKRMASPDLIIIDDIMFMAYELQDAQLFFQFIYDMYDKQRSFLHRIRVPTNGENFWEIRH